MGQGLVVGHMRKAGVFPGRRKRGEGMFFFFFFFLGEGGVALSRPFGASR